MNTMRIMAAGLFVLILAADSAQPSRMSARVDQLSDRIAVLERAKEKLAKRQRVVEASEFVLRDKDGKIRGKWYIMQERDAVVFDLYHGDGKLEGVQLWVQPGPRPGLAEASMGVVGEDGMSSVALEVAGGTPHIAAVNNKGKLLWSAPR